MICLHCGKDVGNHLICPVCADRKSHNAMRHHQLWPLEAVQNKRAKFATIQIKDARHVQMFGCEMTYCWEHVGHGHTKRRLDFDEYQAAANLCPRCHAAIDELLKEIAVCSTSK